jgi:hypothetical protein
MLALLREDDLPGKFRSLKKAASETLIAVPFWGTGAIGALGLNRGTSRVICNLSSGACNPYEIEDLEKLDGITVRTNSRLHAKIYTAKGFAIIGSSNASTNGLAIAGDVSTGWIEANVLTKEPGLVKETCGLFETIWDSDETKPISVSQLNKAKIAWDNRPRSKPSVTATTLLAACREQPELFGSVFVVAYDEDLSRKAKRKLTSLTRQAKGSAGIDNADFRKAWGYQFEERIASGTWLVDLDCRKPSRPRVWGSAQVQTPPSVLIVGAKELDVTIALHRPVQLTGSQRILSISSKEKHELIANAKMILKYKKSELVPLVEAVRIIDDNVQHKARKPPRD